MTNLFVLLVVVGVIAFVVWIVKERTGGTGVERVEKPKYEYKRKQFFMSRAEHECYDALVAAVGEEYYIFAQVHLPTIVYSEARGKDRYGSFSHIDRKSVDFVLCDKQDISPKLAIELDDRSHERADRKDRDGEVERILQNAGVPLLRLENPGQFNPVDLAQKISQSL